MRAKSSIFALCLLLTGLGLSSSAVGTGERSPDQCKSIYIDAARMNQTTVTAQEWGIGQIASRGATRSSQSTGNLLESSYQPTIDCSDAVYKCVRSWGRTLAIPRRGPRLHESYEKDHVKFVVDGCLRFDKEICTVAIVSGRCAQVNPDGSCAKGALASAHSKYDNVDYFIYNDDFGVTALGSTDRPRASIDERVAIASQMVLISNVGIFGRCENP
jgi:hypothetical protein